MKLIYCPVCNLSKSKMVHEISVNSPSYAENSCIYECCSCGAKFTYPYPNEKQLEKIYKGVYHYSPSNLSDNIITLLNYFVLKSDYLMISKHKKTGKVLDIGAGRGDFLKLFNSNQWERWAFDPYISDKETIELTGKIGENVNNYKKLDKYPVNYFDLIILRNIIEHTQNTKYLLDNVSRIMKKGAVLFIRTPNFNSLDHDMFGKNWWVINMEGHMVYWDCQSVANMLSKFHFRDFIINTTKTSGLLSLQRSLFWNIPKFALYFSSFVYSFISFFFRNGGDLLIVCKK